MNITHRENLHQPPASNKLSNLFKRSLSHGFATEEKMGEGNNRDDGKKEKNVKHISNGYFLQKSVASSSLSGKNLFRLLHILLHVTSTLYACEVAPVTKHFL